MIGVRKSLDFIFSKYELKALDDLMPDSHKGDKNDDEEVTMISVHFRFFSSSLCTKLNPFALI